VRASRPRGSICYKLQEVGAAENIEQGLDAAVKVLLGAPTAIAANRLYGVTVG
jgi:hypothetical protein